jgi:hypothetical protein
MGKGVTCGCNCGCGPCVPPPALYFQVDALALTRNNVSISQPVVENTVGEPISTHDFGFDWQVGPAFTVGYRPTKMDFWEFNYFGLQDWDSRQSRTDVGALSLPGAFGAATGLHFGGFDNSGVPIQADTMNVDYSSTIDDGEVNYFWHPETPEVSWMVGFRYFHLAEAFDIFSTDTVGSSEYKVRTLNDLFVGQIGVRFRHCFCERFEVDWTGKVGVFGDNEQSLQTVTNIGDPAIADVSHREGHWAFIGSSSINGSYYLCKNWCVQGGYNCLFVDEVALAPDQLDFTDGPSTPAFGTTIHHGGRVFYHGAHLGLGIHW